MVKKLAASFDAFLASQAMIPQIPRLLGPGLNKADKFPAMINPGDNIETKVQELRAQASEKLKGDSAAEKRLHLPEGVDAAS
eukprot:13934647-Heterocapsa_arctica.AAC.1